MNYYNEFDPKAAAWIRELIAAGAIPPGDVDERSIEDVRPSDLAGYTQCHFFAGIAGWSYALALAGWPSSRPVWTGSCPCQPFSAAGKGAGFDDQRHLWPAWFHLIRECRPPAIFGEQVASKAADPWIDLVHADLEGMGYAFGCVPFPAAGVGAPHIRDRNYWVGVGLADAHDARLEGWRIPAERSAQFAAGARGLAGGLANTDGRHASAERKQPGGQHGLVAQDGGVIRVADPESSGRREECADGGRIIVGDSSKGLATGLVHGGSDHRPGPLHGHWRAADWLACRDGKWRPVIASPQPLANGISRSLGRVCDTDIQAIEEEVNAWEMETGFGRSEGLRDLWNSAHEAAPRFWEAGRLPGLHEAPFLLAFLRQLTEQGWGIPERLSIPGSQVPEGRMRVLWSEVGATCPPRQLRLEGQQAGEYPDALRVLSSVLARHAHQAWEAAHSAYADTCNPLVHGSRGRVQRLRGYGNAIVPQQAAEFVMACMETMQLQLEQAA